MGEVQGVVVLFVFIIVALEIIIELQLQLELQLLFTFQLASWLAPFLGDVCSASREDHGLGKRHPRSLKH